MTNDVIRLPENPTARSTDSAVFWAGVALIVLPLIAAILLIIWPGWLLMLVLIVSPLLVIGYALQVVIAASAFLAPRGVLRRAASRRRALTAAWLTSVGALTVGLFLVDGGDQDWGSAFMYIVGQPGNTVLGDVSTIICTVASIVWIGGWIWLVVEWIVALVRARRSRVAAT